MRGLSWFGLGTRIGHEDSIAGLLEFEDPISPAIRLEVIG
jgi:hypothetical protein